MCAGLEHTADRGHLSLGRLPLCALSPIPQPSLAGSVLQGLRGCISQAPLASGWVWLVRGAGESWEGGQEEGEAGHSPLPCSPSPSPLPSSSPSQSSPTSSHLSSSAAVLLQGQALPAPAPLCPSGPRVPAASCRCIPPGLHGWLLRFPSSEQPVPRIEFSVLNTQRSFCFSWLDLVIHPGSHLKGKGSWSQTVWTRAPALLLPCAGPWTSHSSFAQGRTRAQRGPPCLPTQHLFWPWPGPSSPTTGGMHKWPQGLSPPWVQALC